MKECIISGCENPPDSIGHCHLHYWAGRELDDSLFTRAERKRKALREYLEREKEAGP